MGPIHTVRSCHGPRSITTRHAGAGSMHLEPFMDLRLVKAENIRCQYVATGQLPASMPAQHRLAAHVEELGNVAGSEEALGHAEAPLEKR